MNGLVIIVGMGADLGFELARTFGRHGFGIVPMGRNGNTLTTKAQKLSQEGIDVHPIRADVSDPASLDLAFAETDRLNRPICGLIYNAVARRAKAPSELTAEEVAEDMEVHLLGAIRCTSRVLRRYGNTENGFILFTGGGVALAPSQQAASMSLGKAALRNYALNLAQEMEETGVFVGTVTITQKMQYGTAHSPDRIAAAYMKMAEERSEHEIVI